MSKNINISGFFLHILDFFSGELICICVSIGQKFLTTYLPSLGPINISFDIISLNLGVAFYDSYF